MSRSAVVCGAVILLAASCGSANNVDVVAIAAPTSTGLAAAAPEVAEEKPSGERGARGSLDESFGEEGRAFVRFGPVEHTLEDFDILPDGRIIVAAGARVGEKNDGAILRLTPEGLLDESYGEKGIRHVVGASGEAVSAVSLVAPLADGSIYVAGHYVPSYASSRPNHDFFVMRLLADGKADPTFGKGKSGFVSRNLESMDNLPRGLFPTSDGGVIVAGVHAKAEVKGAPMLYSGPGKDSDVFLAKFRVDGSPDSGFGTGGVVYLDATPGRDVVVDTAMMRDGRIVISGYVDGFVGIETKAFAMRVMQNGSVDSSFGRVGTGTKIVEKVLENPGGLAVREDGAIWLGGESERGPVVAVRLTPDGEIDASFGDSGIGPSVSWGNISELIPLPDGGIVSVGSRREGGTKSDFFVSSWDATGRPDRTFGKVGDDTFGSVVLGFRGGELDNYGARAARDRSSRLLVGGISGKSLAFARLWL